MTLELWRGSEAEVRAALGGGRLPAVATVVCLRRREPAWFVTARLAGADARQWVHHPVPPSSADDCGRALLRLFDGWQALAKPVLVFCKEGVHRTGMVAAIHLWRTAPPSDALDEYLSGVDGCPRRHELELISRLGPHGAACARAAATT